MFCNFAICVHLQLCFDIFSFFLSFLHRHHMKKFFRKYFLFSGTSEGGGGEMPLFPIDLSHICPEILAIVLTKVLIAQDRRENNLGSTCSANFTV